MSGTLRSVNRYILEEFSQGNSGWYKNTSAETVTEEILSSGIGKKYLDTIIKRLAGLYTDREDIVNRFALLSGIVQLIGLCMEKQRMQN